MSHPIDGAAKGSASDAARAWMAGVGAAVALSGAASLMYQVAWTRRLASVTSATVTAQAVVLAVFLAGLGLGALWAGRRAAGLRRPLRAYAAVEAVAAMLALASMPLFAHSEWLRSAVGGLVGSLDTGLAVQLLALTGFLFLPAAALGASLPFVVEAVERARPGRNRTARAIGALYALNTLGAAGGCLLAGFVTVEAVGLLRTVAAGAVLALAAALGAFALERRSEPADATPSLPESGRVAMGGSRGGRPALLLSLALLAGFVGLGAEVVWTRLLSLVVLNTVYAFSQVLASVLLGIAAGSGAASLLIRRVGRGEDPARALLRAAGGAALLAALLLVGVPSAVVALAGAAELQLDLASGLSLRGHLLLLALLVPPSAAVAALLPLLVAVAGHVHAGSRGADRFARLYAANTVGSVAGSLCAGWLLLPYLGTAAASAVLVALATALALVLLHAGGAPSRWRGVAAATGAVGIALSFSSGVPLAVYAERIEPGTRILEFREGVESDVLVTEDAAGRRRLWINSSWVAGTGGGHRVLGHVPALLVAHPRKALGIALGTGQTFASVHAHGFDALVCVELDGGVIDLSTRWFAEANGRLFERPDVQLLQDDGRAFLRTTGDRFDLIVLEPLQAWTVGTSNLYSREFYREARRALAPGGVVAQWIPFYGQGAAETRAMVRAALEVFPEATLWLDDHDGILVLQTQPVALDPAALWARARARGVTADLGRNALDTPEDLLSLVVMGPRGLARWTEGAALLTDDHPFLEFAAARDLRHHAYRPILRSLHPWIDDPGSLLADEAREAGAPLAERAKQIRAAVLAERSVEPTAWDARARALEGALASAPGSRLVAKRYRNLVLDWALTLERAGEVAAAEGVYRRALHHAQELEEASVNLSLLYARQQRFALARAALDRPWRAGPVRDSALRTRARIDAAMARASGTATPTAQR